ncbi:VPLPA-CTERM sorting domain-containing protein [uncultured Roseobacter sp.]|uniref:VPLPA-CTERM sorting domain-containing protein n=1 Tax=uncultured Roseobacter sp. TaxID=114847 RepID=UPI002639D5DC|nr:VPLPA-CTERM sorting domain-containing protein [uncultured Roseobacter sp.]
MKQFLAAAAVAALFGGAGAAQAASFTVDFSGNTVPAPSLSFNDIGGSGVNVTVTADDHNRFNGDLGGESFGVGQYSGGLGICSGTVTTTGDYCRHDDHQVDGGGSGASDEMAIFTFSETVTLRSVGFSFIGSNDEFDFRMYDPLGQFFASQEPGVGTGPNNEVVYSFSQIWTGSIFGIGAQDKNDEFKIKSLTFDFDEPDDNPSPVPLPAAAWMLLAGVGGLGAMKRRNKKRAA